MTTKGDKKRQPNSSVAKELRDTQVVAKRLEGKSTQQIADELGIGRQAVSNILNSDQVKAKVKEIDKKLASGIDDAIETVLRHVKDDYKAARDLLKNYGSMKETLDLNHNFPKPTVIKRRSGDEVVLGTKEEDEE